MSAEPTNWRKEVEETPLATSILRHWRESRPKMCKDLEAKGLLFRSVMEASNRTANLLVTLHRDGLDPFEAREQAFKEWYRLPDEKAQPNLTFDPATGRAR